MFFDITNLHSNARAVVAESAVVVAENGVTKIQVRNYWKGSGRGVGRGGKL